jgi:hypothetical protein
MPAPKSERHTRIFESLWTDDDFTSLSWQAQWLWQLAMTAPGRTLCGAFDWRPKRLAARAVGMTADMIEAVAPELEAAHFLVIDRDTEEALVRSVVRRDGAMRSPNMAVAVVRAMAEVASPRLRAVLTHELQRMHREEPDLQAWGKPEVWAALNRPALDVRTETAPLAIVHHISG